MPVDVRNRCAGYGLCRGMERVDNQALARLCRVQAGLASTEEGQSTLIELALAYERAAARDLTDVVKALTQEPE